MIPQFGEVLGESIPAYFAMLMTGFAVAIGLGVVWARRSQLDHDVIIDLGLACLISGVAGARILHVFVDGYFWDYVHMCTDPGIVEWPYPRGACQNLGGVWDTAANVCRPPEGDCFAWAKFWQGGLVWYGGLLGAGSFEAVGRALLAALAIGAVAASSAAFNQVLERDLGKAREWYARAGFDPDEFLSGERG